MTAEKKTTATKNFCNTLLIPLLLGVSRHASSLSLNFFLRRVIWKTHLSYFKVFTEFSLPTQFLCTTTELCKLNLRVCLHFVSNLHYLELKQLTGEEHAIAFCKCAKSFCRTLRQEAIGSDKKAADCLQHCWWSWHQTLNR